MENPSEATKASYQATAQAFANNVADLAPLESIEKFITLLPSHPTMIDLGCGSGRDAKLFSEKGADVLGIDFSSNLLDIAKTHAPNAKFALMDIEAMHFPNNSFDGAWSACSLSHLSKEKLPDVLANIHALLKTNGIFYLALKKGSGETFEIDNRYEGNHKKFWSFYEEAELKNILQAAQFKILDFATVEKNSDYQTHTAFRVFCQKN